MTILVDVANLGYACLHASAPLRAGSVETTAVFGVLNKLRLLREEFAGRMVVLWDGKSWRYDHFAAYKANRAEDSAGQDISRRWSEQARILAAILPSLGVEQLTIPNYEADDTAAMLVRRSSGHVVLASGDTDWLQLVTEDGRVLWFDPIRSRRVGAMDFIAKTQVPHGYAYATMKALRGDVSDNIPGVGGVGEKTALEIAKCGSVPDFLTAFKEEPGRFSRLAARFAADDGAQSRFQRNMGLIYLHHPEVPLALPSRRVPAAFDMDRFAACCERLAFGSILRGLSAWERNFAA